ncbi:serine hydrolase [Pararobbsia alpina]|uniref:serine hydrolase n=1 Tax=Pararobbsia alpina TaxID=621374 RepID=UPI003CCDCEDE
MKVPDNIHDEDQLLAYSESCRAAYRAGTYLTYSNPDIGTLRAITAQSMGRSFTALMKERLFPSARRIRMSTYIPRRARTATLTGHCEPEIQEVGNVPKSILCVPSQGGHALKAVKAGKRWLHLGHLELLHKRCGHTLD